MALQQHNVVYMQLWGGESQSCYTRPSPPVHLLKEGGLGFLRLGPHAPSFQDRVLSQKERSQDLGQSFHKAGLFPGDLGYMVTLLGQNILYYDSI